MKRLVIPVIFLFLLILCSIKNAQAVSNLGNATFHPKTDTAIDFDTGTPPAIFWVEDSNGDISGANPSLPVNAVGEQQQIFPNGLTDIPNSFCQQDNELDVQTDEANSHTGWEVGIITTEPQVYSLYVKGIQSGVGDIIIGQLYPNPSFCKNLNYSVLVSEGIIRKYTVDFNPSQHTVDVTPVVSNGDLLNDVKAACSMNLITSDRVCRRLEREAEAIQDFLTQNRNEPAEQLTLVFLHYLGDSRPANCRDEDDHVNIKEPALTILKNDAKALLTQLGGKDQDHHHGDQWSR